MQSIITKFILEYTNLRANSNATGKCGHHGVCFHHANKIFQYFENNNYTEAQFIELKNVIQTDYYINDVYLEYGNNQRITNLKEGRFKTQMQSLLKELNSAKVTKFMKFLNNPNNIPKNDKQRYTFYRNNIKTLLKYGETDDDFQKIDSWIRSHLSEITLMANHWAFRIRSYDYYTKASQEKKNHIHNILRVITRSITQARKKAAKINQEAPSEKLTTLEPTTKVSLTQLLNQATTKAIKEDFANKTTEMNLELALQQSRALQTQIQLSLTKLFSEATTKAIKEDFAKTAEINLELALQQSRALQTQIEASLTQLLNKATRKAIGEDFAEAVKNNPGKTKTSILGKRKAKTFSSFKDFVQNKPQNPVGYTAS